MKIVSYADVESALAQLVSRREPITLTSLRAALGNRGSMSTLSKHLQKWKQEQALTSLPPGQINPAPEPILAAVQGVWQQIFEKGQQELLEQQKLFDTQRQEFEQALSIAQEQAKQAMIEAAELRKGIQEISLQCEKLQQQSINDAHRADLAETKAHQEEKSRQEMSHLLTQALQELKNCQHEMHKHFQEQQQALILQKDKIQKECDILVAQEQKRAEVELSFWKKEYQDIQQRCSHAESQLKELPQLQEVLALLSAQQLLLEQSQISKQYVLMEKILKKWPESYPEYRLVLPKMFA